MNPGYNEQQAQRLEVIDLLIADGYIKHYAVEAVDRVMLPHDTTASLYNHALAWLRDDWSVLSPLYMSIALHWLICSGYIIDEFRFTEHPRFVGVILCINKLEPLIGCVPWKVLRVKDGFSGPVGLTPTAFCKNCYI